MVCSSGLWDLTPPLNYLILKFHCQGNGKYWGECVSGLEGEISICLALGNEILKTMLWVLKIYIIYKNVLTSN